MLLTLNESQCVVSLPFMSRPYVCVPEVRGTVFADEGSITSTGPHVWSRRTPRLVTGEEGSEDVGTGVVPVRQRASTKTGTPAPGDTPGVAAPADGPGRRRTGVGANNGLLPPRPESTPTEQVRVESEGRAVVVRVVSSTPRGTGVVRTGSRVRFPTTPSLRDPR